MCEPVATTITGADEWGDPVDLTVSTQEHHADQIMLCGQFSGQPDLVAVLTVEQGLDLYAGLDTAVTAAVAISIPSTDADSNPLPLHLETSGYYATVALAFGPDADPVVVLDTSALRNAVGAALTAAPDDTDGM